MSRNATAVGPQTAIVYQRRVLKMLERVLSNLEPNVRDVMLLDPPGGFTTIDDMLQQIRFVLDLKVKK